MLNGRYVLVERLGQGDASTVWLARDFKTGNMVALKIQRSSPSYTQAAQDEVEIGYKVVREAINADWLAHLAHYQRKNNFSRSDFPIVQLLDAFSISGPNGMHVCMVFELLGISLKEVLRRSPKGIPADAAKEIIRQVLLGLHFLHRFAGVIHGDLRPENVLLCLTKSEQVDISERRGFRKTKRYEARLKDFQEAHVKGDMIATRTPTNGEVVRASNRKKKKQMKNKLNRRKKREKEKAAKRAQVISELKAFAQSPLDFSRVEQRGRQGELKARRGRSHSDPVKKTSRSFHASGGKSDDAVDGDHMHILCCERLDARLDASSDEEPAEEVKLKLIDFGRACWTNRQPFYAKIHQRSYRAPEVTLGLRYGPPADIWAAACLFFELLTGKKLFIPQRTSHYPSAEDQLAQIREILGRTTPKWMVTASPLRRSLFDKQGNLKRINVFGLSDLKTTLVAHGLSGPVAEEAAAFLEAALEVDPEKRPTAEDLLDMGYLQGEEDIDEAWTPARTHEKIMSCFEGEEADEEDNSELGNDSSLKQRDLHLEELLSAPSIDRILNE
eukprot:TRINITY_DN7841_c0_g2_i10.p1 TRINITY_DN7841_c0_g2~~TRINITY_DN7841_c0_g2_i10.p1  ORF type:complete len:557 (-),score=114.99 TRINITY_DN7841_c0_g2_i10:92-1762(-)